MVLVHRLPLPGHPKVCFSSWVVKRKDLQTTPWWKLAEWYFELPSRPQIMISCLSSLCTNNFHLWPLTPYSCWHLIVALQNLLSVRLQWARYFGAWANQFLNTPIFIFSTVNSCSYISFCPCSSMDECLFSSVKQGETQRSWKKQKLWMKVLIFLLDAFVLIII